MELVFKRVREELPVSITVELRGEDRGEFIYAFRNEVAIELSLDKNKYWVEYWKGTKDSSEKDEEFMSLEETIASIKKWLL